jgi:hypothetical protein
MFLRLLDPASTYLPVGSSSPSRRNPPAELIMQPTRIGAKANRTCDGVVRTCCLAILILVLLVFYVFRSVAGSVRRSAAHVAAQVRIRLCVRFGGRACVGRCRGPSRCRQGSPGSVRSLLAVRQGSISLRFAAQFAVRSLFTARFVVPCALFAF